MLILLTSQDIMTDLRWKLHNFKLCYPPLGELDAIIGYLKSAIKIIKLGLTLCDTKTRMQKIFTGNKSWGSGGSTTSYIPDPETLPLQMPKQQQTQNNAHRSLWKCLVECFVESAKHPRGSRVFESYWYLWLGWLSWSEPVTCQGKPGCICQIRLSGSPFPIGHCVCQSSFEQN